VFHARELEGRDAFIIAGTVSDEEAKTKFPKG